MSFRDNIEKLTVKNNNFRKVLSTTQNMQLAVMSLKAGEEIGLETHPHTSQFIRVEAGRCKAIIGSKNYYLKDGDAIIVPPNKPHNIINTGESNLKLYTIYTPPEHLDALVQKFKDD